MSVQTKTYSAINLYNEGRAFIKLYQKSQECFTPIMRDEEVPGIFCLLMGLELVLKGYLALKNDNYCKAEKLKNCGHNFEKISNEIKSTDENLYKILEGTFKKIGYLKSWDTFYRYPENFSIISIPADWRMILDWSGENPILKKPEPFNRIINYIDEQFKSKKN